MRPERFKTLMLVALEAHLARRKVPVLPAGGDLLWLWFTEIRTAKALPQPIDWQDLAAYRSMSGWPLRPDHCRLIMAMDRAYRDLCRPSPEGSPGGRRSAIPSSPINADVFDAMFD